MPDVLSTQIFAGGENKPFGEVTAADVRARAEELRGIGAIPAMARLGSVALAWAQFAQLMEAGGHAKVSDLDSAVAEEWAVKLQVVPAW